jgi:phage tail protein X
MTKGAVTALLAAAHGIPRRINVIADNALLTGFGAGVRPITAKIVQEAIKAVDGAPALPLRISRLGAIAAGLIAVASVAILAAHEWQTWAHFSSAPPAAIAPLSSQQASAAMPTPKAAASRPTATAPAALPTGPLTANLPASAPMAIRPTAPPPPEPGGDKWPPPPGVMAGTNTLPAPGAAPVAAPMVSPRDNVAMATDLAAIPAVPPPFADTRPTDDQAPAKKIQRPMAPPRVLANMRRYRIVHGETVNAILRRFYGKITDDTLSSFIFANPSVKNRDRIIAGSYVLVPASLLQPNTHRSQ